MAFLSEEQLHAIGFKSIGHNVRLSEKASIYNASAISIGDHTRIDDFCILSAGAGGITIGRHIHIGCYSSLIGQGRIIMEDFTGMSPRVSVFSSTDDFSGMVMTGPAVPSEFRDVKNGDVIFRKHSVAATGAVIMPNVELGEGAVVGALSLVTVNCEPFTINIGVPARKCALRERTMLDHGHALNQRDHLDSR